MHIIVLFLVWFVLFYFSGNGLNYYDIITDGKFKGVKLNVEINKKCVNNDTRKWLLYNRSGFVQDIGIDRANTDNAAETRVDILFDDKGTVWDYSKL